jgi:hypothetical protein
MLSSRLIDDKKLFAPSAREATIRPGNKLQLKWIDVGFLGMEQKLLYNPRVLFRG